MLSRFRLLALAALALTLSSAVARGGQAQPPDEDGVLRLLRRLEQAVQVGTPNSYYALMVPSANRDRANIFTTLELRPGATRVAVIERDRQALPNAGLRLMVDLFVEHGDRARAATWQLDIRRIDDVEWRIADQERFSSVDNLYKLSVNPEQQFDAREFTVRSEDLELTLVEGSVFRIDTDQGITGLILLGRGEMRFSPSPETEKGQVRIFADADVLESRFDAAYIRAGDLTQHADMSTLIARPVDPRLLRRADEVFREESAKSFVLELADLSRENWSLLPSGGDFLAETRTRRFNTITYARSRSEAEDISVFDRRRQRNIAVYASREKLATRGRFYNEDDLAPYDVLHYDLDLKFSPERLWMEGVATMRLKVRSILAGQITLKLAESLVVHSVVSDRLGRLFNLRAKNQNTVLVNLPISVMKDEELTLTVAYGGRLPAQTADRETLLLDAQRGFEQQPQLEPSVIRSEPNYLYSNRSQWYPQAPVTDYVTARIRVTVPGNMSCVATGVVSPESPVAMFGDLPTERVRVYEFAAERPVRYLAILVSRLSRSDRVTVAFNDADGSPATNGPQMAGAVNESLDLIVESQPRQVGRGRELAPRAVDIVNFYHSLIGDAPYASFTLALVEHNLPGGHSPGYFAALNQPLPNTPVAWRSDPAAFEGFPEFFMAHEVAHQWWGQAVGWRNYHEQWLSEGFAQYFAALYAQHHRGDETFAGVMRQLRKWGIQESDQGPIYLGYRLGHIRNESRVFRALVYNKGAAVLHMLRRLVGDEAFFRGLRRYYVGARFEKAGTEDLRFAMEQESGQSLERFFERWVYAATLPNITFAYRVEPGASGGSTAVLRFEQTGELFDVPITVALHYADRRSVDVVVPVTDRIVEQRVTLEGVLRTIDISDDHGTLAEIRRATP
jgi:hypothetical protein